MAHSVPYSRVVVFCSGMAQLLVVRLHYTFMKLSLIFGIIVRVFGVISCLVGIGRFGFLIYYLFHPKNIYGGAGFSGDYVFWAYIFPIAMLFIVGFALIRAHWLIRFTGIP